MEFFGDFIAMALIAISLENAIFTRALGVGKSMFTVQRTRQILAYGGVVTLMTTVVSMICSPLSELAVVKTWTSLYRSILYLAVLSVVYVLCHLLFTRLPKPFSTLTGGFLPLAFFNCAMFGSVMLSSVQSYNFAQYVGFGFGTGAGFTIAYLLVSEGRRRIELSNVPRAFRGFPAAIMYIGILSLAFYGLAGHQLPL